MHQGLRAVLGAVVVVLIHAAHEIGVVVEQVVGGVRQHQPQATSSQAQKSNSPARKAKMPASTAERKVMISTAARVAISQREMRSSACHSSFADVGDDLQGFAPHGGVQFHGWIFLRKKYCNGNFWALPKIPIEFHDTSVRVWQTVSTCASTSRPRRAGPGRGCPGLR